MDELHKCKICGKEFSTGGALGGHISAGHGNAQKENSRKTKSLKKIRHKKICPKCSKVFYVERFLKKDGEEYVPVNENKFCSGKCANSREHSKETKLKISKSIKGKSFKRKVWKNKSCKICGKDLGLVSSKPAKNLYCKDCYLVKDEIRKQKVSVAVKEQYKNGKKVYGGTSKWLTYNNFKVQGTYEYRVCKILDKMLELKLIKNWEYTNDRIEYFGLDKNKHNYLLDFKVIENDNNFYYIEVKGYEKPEDKLKWAAVKNKGYKLLIWFKKDIIEKEIIFK
jgi:hypothetical protein